MNWITFSFERVGYLKGVDRVLIVDICKENCRGVVFTSVTVTVLTRRFIVSLKR